METFYQRFERLLKAKKATKAAIAAASGMSSNGMVTWGVTGSLPRSDVAIKMARFLGTSVEYLIFGELQGLDIADTANEVAYKVATLSTGKQRIIAAVASALEGMDV